MDVWWSGWSLGGAVDHLVERMVAWRSGLSLGGVVDRLVERLIA